MIDDADTYGWELIADRVQRAMKPYKCAECCREIEKGEPYHYELSRFDGRVDAYRTCAHCHAGPCSWLNRVCHGYLRHGVLDDLEEHWGVYVRPEIEDPMFVGRCIVGMRRKWRWRDGSVMRVPKLPERSAA